MRILAAVSVAILAVALGSPAALAQGDARESYGPVQRRQAAAESQGRATAKPSRRSRRRARQPAQSGSGRSRPGNAGRAQPATMPATDGKAGTRPAARRTRATPRRRPRSRPPTNPQRRQRARPPHRRRKPPGLHDAYTALPLTERLAIQLDLAWAGDYRGLADGEFSDKLAEAVKAYQKRNKIKVTGVLTPEERAALAAAVAPRQSEAGWRLVEDPVDRRAARHSRRSSRPRSPRCRPARAGARSRASCRSRPSASTPARRSKPCSSSRRSCRGAG